MNPEKDAILGALERVKFPGFSRDIVSVGAVRDVSVDDGRVLVVGIEPAHAAADGVRRDVEREVRTLEGVRACDVRFQSPQKSSSALHVLGQTPSTAAKGGLGHDLIPAVRSTIAVASGKGGVGKSTVAVNLAVAMARRGVRVGLLDADIYGPSIPLMMGNRTERVRLDDSGQRILPFERFGVRFMSLGFLVDPDQAVIWRGPLVMKALEQLLRDVVWGELDLLVVDMPPGTGDAQLTMSQRVRLAGAVIVTTPQDVALADAIKGVAMFQKVDVPVLGIVENMSYYVCPSCSTRSEIFGHGGGRDQAAKLGVPFLGEIPLDASIREAGDAGRPVTDEEEAERSSAFFTIADAVLATISGKGGDAANGEGLLDRFRRKWGEPGR